MTDDEDPLRINEQFVRAYGTDDAWMAYCDAHGVDPGPRMRLAIRQERGEFAPTQPVQLCGPACRGPLPKRRSLLARIILGGRSARAAIPSPDSECPDAMAHLFEQACARVMDASRPAQTIRRDIDFLQSAYRSRTLELKRAVGPDSERVRELEAENTELRENWANLRARIAGTSQQLWDLAIEQKNHDETARLYAKRSGVEVVRDYMRGYS